MSIEDTLRTHYRRVEVDESAELRLRSLIATLDDRPASARAGRAVLAALVLAACVLAAVTAGVLWAGRASGSQDPVADGVPPKLTAGGRPAQPRRAGFTGVVNSHGVAGLIRLTDADAVENRAAGTASAARVESARRYLTVVLPLFDGDGSRVIGEWNAAGTSVLAVFCAHRDGIAFRAPAAGRSGNRTPLDAARAVADELSLAGFGDSHTVWTVRSRTAKVATLTAAATTLTAQARPDGSWVVTSGQRCFT